MILSGKEVSNKIINDIKEFIQNNNDYIKTIGLASIRIGDNPDDIAYEKAIRNYSNLTGIKYESYCFEPNSLEDIILKIKEINLDNTISGILVFRPLASAELENQIKSVIDITKDVDGIVSGISPTALAVIEILKYYQIPLSNKQVTLIGRSDNVGKPLHKLLVEKGAIVNVCHSKTADLAAECRSADIIISAAGKANLVTKEMVKPNQTIIDVGINVNDSGEIIGDVNYDAVSKIVQNITPVPGGVGSVTTAVLFKNVLGRI